MNEKESKTIEPIKNWSTMGRPACGIRIFGQLTTTATLTDSEATYTGMFFAEDGRLFLNIIAPDLEGGIFVGSIKIGWVTEQGELVFEDEIEVLPMDSSYNTRAKGMTPLQLRLGGGRRWRDSRLAIQV